MKKIIIEREKNQVKLLFNPLFYQIQFIDRAIQDFSEICDVKKIDNMLLIKPKVDIDIEMLGYEFYNYVFCLSRNL